MMQVLRHGQRVVPWITRSSRVMTKWGGGKLWELAVVSEAFSDWSSRHTRLRYQAVIFSLVTVMASIYGIKELNFPAIIKFDNSPSDTLVFIGLLAFTSYSVVSFGLQHLIESRNQPNFIREFKLIINQLNESLLGSEKSLYESFSKASDQLDKIDKANIRHEDRRVYEKINFDLSYQTDWEFYIDLFLQAKDELNKLSPGYFSIGNQLITSLELFQKALSHFFEDLDSFTNTYEKSLITKIDLNMFGLIQEAKTIPVNLANLGNDLSKFARARYLHTSLMPFLIPLSMSIVMTIFGLLFFLFRIMHGTH